MLGVVNLDKPVGPTSHAMLPTTRRMPKPSWRCSFGRMSAIIAACAGPPTSENSPTSAATGNSHARSFTAPNVNALTALAQRRMAALRNGPGRRNPATGDAADGNESVFTDRSLERVTDLGTGAAPTASQVRANAVGDNLRSAHSAYNDAVVRGSACSLHHDSEPMTITLRHSPTVRVLAFIALFDYLLGAISGPELSPYDPLAISTNQTVPKFLDLTIEDETAGLGGRLLLTLAKRRPATRLAAEMRSVSKTVRAGHR